MWWRFLHKKYQDHIPCSFAYKVVCIDDRFTKPTIIYRGENAAYEFIKAILEEYKYCKKIIEEYFNKKLIITEEENLFQKSNNSWICKNLLIIAIMKKKTLEIIVT